jgi:flagellar hook-length control protein FliK
MQWLAGLQRAGAAADAGTAVAPGATTASNLNAPTSGTAKGNAASGAATTDGNGAQIIGANQSDPGGTPGLPGMRANSDATDAPALNTPQSLDPSVATAAAQVVVGQRQADRPVSAQTGAPSSMDGAAAASAMAFASTLSAVRDTNAPVSVAIPTPVNAPEFAQSLGVQMSVLARDGVQHAELHLNPADMGPVSVQISMDGTQARVDFGADTAATRHAIEAGMPELASALRDAGFTLAGGGVSQHSRGRSEAGDASGSAGSGSRYTRSGGDVKDPVAAPARRTVKVGGLDLYA